jgi:hypothetical protein
MSWEKGKSELAEIRRTRAGWGEKGIRRRRDWTGWLACPAPFFVEPSSPHRSHQPAMPSSDTQHGRSHGSAGSFWRYRGFSTAIWLGVRSPLDPSTRPLFVWRPV